MFEHCVCQELEALKIQKSWEVDSAKHSDKVPDSSDQVGEESKENGTSGKERETFFQ